MTGCERSLSRLKDGRWHSSNVTDHELATLVTALYVGAVLGAIGALVGVRWLG